MKANKQTNCACYTTNKAELSISSGVLKHVHVKFLMVLSAGLLFIVSVFIVTYL